MSDVPVYKLRFKADDGSQFPDWEEKAFGDFMDTHLEKTSDKDKYPLYSLTIESGVQPKTDRYEREFLVKKKGDNYKIVPPNAFVYNPMNLRFGALKVNHEKFSVSVSGYYDVFSLKDDNTLAFWENYLVTPKMLNYYFSIATGSLIEKLRVHYSQFIRIKKPLPSLPEQQKIAEFLSTVDTVIEKQKETVSAWEERKKGVMQKLFSQEVRFKADDGSDFPDWEEKVLDKEGFFYGGLVGKNKADFEKGGSKFITYINVYKNTFANRDMIGKVNVGDSEKQNKVLYGDILFTQSSETVEEVGLSSVYLYDDEPYLNSFCMGFRFNNLSCVCPKYMGYCMRSENVRKNIMLMGQGISRINLGAKRLKNVSYKFPCLAEQQKIADCLSALDEVTEKQRSTLATWKELKKGLLQQMFV